MLISSSTVPMSPSRATQATSAPTSGVRIEVQPGEGNVANGNRSKNTIEVSAATANRETSTVISREQAINSVERRLQQNTLNQLTSNKPAPNTLKVAALPSSNIDTGAVAEIATLRNQQRLAQTYLNATPSNSSQPSLNTTNTSTGNGGVDLYNKAVGAYVKQALFFSGVDNIKSGISTKA